MPTLNIVDLEADQAESKPQSNKDHEEDMNFQTEKPNGFVKVSFLDLDKLESLDAEEEQVT